jgi:hypothetical protein
VENMMWTRTALLLTLCGLVGFILDVVAQPAAGDDPAPSSIAKPRGPGAATFLGDLTPYRAIAVETLRIVNTGDLAAGKKRIKDLEVAWDRAEAKMKPLSPEQWTTVDVAMDRALKEVRAWRATQERSAEALKALISTIDATK